MSLKDDIESDQDTFFDPEEFAVTASWRKVDTDEDPVLIIGNFDSKVSIETGAHMGMSQSKSYTYSFTCKYSDVREMKMDNLLSIGDKKFLVVFDPVESNGFTQIILNPDLS